MIIRYVSDTHLDFSPLSLPISPADKDTILVVAGDIGNFSSSAITTKQHLETWSNQFKTVLFVCGNHDYYGSSLAITESAIEKWINDQNISNLIFLNRKTHVIDGICFIGTTLWTDYNNNDSHAKSIARASMADYHYIHNSTLSGDITPDELLKIHQQDKFFIFEEHKKAFEQGLKSIVISHHLPSFKSVHPFYASSMLNSAFASNMDNDIEHSDIDVWIHGHTHYCFDYILGNTKIKCNPRGYVFSNRIENADFDPLESFTI